MMGLFGQKPFIQADMEHTLVNNIRIGGWHDGSS